MLFGLTDCLMDCWQVEGVVSLPNFDSFKNRGKSLAISAVLRNSSFTF